MSKRRPHHPAGTEEPYFRDTKVYITTFPGSRTEAVRRERAGQQLRRLNVTDYTFITGTNGRRLRGSPLGDHIIADSLVAESEIEGVLEGAGIFFKKRKNHEDRLIVQSETKNYLRERGVQPGEDLARAITAIEDLKLGKAGCVLSHMEAIATAEAELEATCPFPKSDSRYRVLIAESDVLFHESLRDYIDEVSGTEGAYAVMLGSVQMMKGGMVPIKTKHPKLDCPTLAHSTIAYMLYGQAFGPFQAALKANLLMTAQEGGILPIDAVYGIIQQLSLNENGKWPFANPQHQKIADAFMSHPDYKPGLRIYACNPPAVSIPPTKTTVGMNAISKRAYEAAYVLQNSPLTAFSEEDAFRIHDLVHRIHPHSPLRELADEIVMEACHGIIKPAIMLRDLDCLARVDALLQAFEEKGYIHKSIFTIGERKQDIPLGDVLLGLSDERARHHMLDLVDEMILLSPQKDISLKDVFYDWRRTHILDSVDKADQFSPLYKLFVQFLKEACLFSGVNAVSDGIRYNEVCDVDSILEDFRRQGYVYGPVLLSSSSGQGPSPYPSAFQYGEIKELYRLLDSISSGPLYPMANQLVKEACIFDIAKTELLLDWLSNASLIDRWVKLHESRGYICRKCSDDMPLKEALLIFPGHLGEEIQSIIEEIDPKSVLGRLMVRLVRESYDIQMSGDMLTDKLNEVNRFTRFLPPPRSIRELIYNIGHYATMLVRFEQEGYFFHRPGDFSKSPSKTYTHPISYWLGEGEHFPKGLARGTEPLSTWRDMVELQWSKGVNVIQDPQVKEA